MFTSVGFRLRRIWTSKSAPLWEASQIIRRMQLQPILIIRKAISLFLASSLLLTACDIGFTPEVEPLVIEEPGDQPFQEQPIDEAETIHELEEQDVEPSQEFDGFTSDDAIALCEEREYFGDKDVGMCLAPGGDTYYIWEAPDKVIAIERDNTYVDDFAAAVVNRANALGDVNRLARDWPRLLLLFGEVFAIGGTCGGAIFSALTGAGLIFTLPLAGGCGYSSFQFFNDAEGITRDAEDFVNSINDFIRFDADARYNYCRMEGMSDEQCR